MEQVIQFDMTQTLFIAVLLLLLGKAINKKVTLFTRYCIPGAVVGGLIFAVIALILRQTGIAVFEFDSTLQQFFMNLFFTASGFGASMALLKKGGKLVLIFLAIAAGTAFLQNVLPMVLAGPLGVEPMIALMTGSIPMTGGHGNAASFGPLAEQMGFTGANAIAVAAATFGLISGSIMGGPIASKLIDKKNLFTPDTDADAGADAAVTTAHFSPKVLTKSFHLIFIALGLGSLFFIIFKTLLPSVTLPIHVMGMLGGVIVRIIMDVKKIEVPETEIDAVGDVCLGVFVSMAVFTMRLWELTALAIPIIILLFAQIVLMYVIAKFVTFKLMGRNFDAAIITAGHVGFGLGAVPVSMANMNALSAKYKYSKLAFFVVPIIGGLFSNFTNAAIITLFMNWCK
ncbi:MAG: sodium/glutamate symporter [Lachnospiraceae bacterium]